MAEIGVAAKTGIIPEAETTQGPTKSFSVNGKITPDIINDLVKKYPEPMENDKFMGLLKSAVEKRPITSSMETNTSIAETTIAPQKPKTREELKEAAKETKRLANLEEKRKREQWNQRHAPIGYYKK